MSRGAPQAEGVCFSYQQLAAFVGSLPSVIPGRREAHQAQRGLQGKCISATIDRTQDSGLGRPVRQTLLIETKP